MKIVLVVLCIAMAQSAVFTETWIVQQSAGNPDGYPRPVFIVERSNSDSNRKGFGLVAGPEIRVRTGDFVNITVVNQLRDVEISIHWHGILMKNNAWMDGTLGITQCGIAPRKKFVYYFQVLQSPGTYWWHSHGSTPFTDGIYGAFIIEEEKDEKQKYALDQVVFVQDWLHEDHYSSTTKYLSKINQYKGFTPDYPWPVNNVLINGIGQFECKWISEEQCEDIRRWGWHWFYNISGRMPERQPGKGRNAQCLPVRPPFLGKCIPRSKHIPESCYLGTENCNQFDEQYAAQFFCKYGTKIKLRVINTGQSLPIRFWIDRHEFTIIAKDGINVVPDGPHKALFINLGQRYDIEISCSANGEYRYQVFAAAAYEFYPGSALRYMEMFSFGMLNYEVLDLKSKIASPENPPSSWPNKNLSKSWNGYNSDEFISLREFKLISFDSTLTGIIPPAQKRVLIHTRSKGNWPEYYPESDHSGESLEWWQINNSSAVRLPNQPLTEARYFGLPFDDDEVYGRGFNDLSIEKLHYVPNDPIWYEIILINYESQQHPWHMHGHIMYLTGFGWLNNFTKWSSKKFSEDASRFHQGNLIYEPKDFNIPDLNMSVQTCHVADTITIPPFSFAVFRIRADNPGPWILHCHMNYHMSAGLFMIFSTESFSGSYALEKPPEGYTFCGSTISERITSMAGEKESNFLYGFLIFVGMIMACLLVVFVYQKRKAIADVYQPISSNQSPISIELGRQDQNEVDE